MQPNTLVPRPAQALLGALIVGSALVGAQAGAADFKDRSIKLSYVTAKDSPYGQGVAKFAELAARKSDGKIKVRGYSDGQLGAEVQSISGAQGGVLEMALVSTAAAAGPSTARRRLTTSSTRASSTKCRSI